jgi:DNA-binding response OmpR family regulator
MIHMCRQQTPSPDSGILRFPPLSIELMNRRVFYDGAQIVLSKREFDLLVILAKNSGEVVTFEQIGQELYGTYLESDRKNIMVLASRLRKKLGGEEMRGVRIETVWGKGYKFFQN